MKKIISIVLLTVLCFALTACFTPSVESYVEANREELIETFNSSFGSSGYSCETEVRAEGNGMIFDVKIDALEDLTQEQKDLLQETYDGMSETFESSFEQMQEGLSSLEYVVWNICEADGDIAAVIKAGNK